MHRGGSPSGVGRRWTLDPIHGAKGFLRNEQHALALLVEGTVEIGVLGCPNLPCDARPGALFVAVTGGGARLGSLWDVSDLGHAIAPANPSRPSEARSCESVESGHSDQSESADVARHDASIHLRLPTRADYGEKIWDHAAASTTR